MKIYASYCDDNYLYPEEGVIYLSFFGAFPEDQDHLFWCWGIINDLWLHIGRALSLAWPIIFAVTD